MPYSGTKRLRTLILVLTGVVVVTIAFARWYYRRQNKWVDPRIAPARELYGQYNSLAAHNDYQRVLDLLEKIEDIYEKYPHYALSYEMGVLENNRAAVYLTMAQSFELDTTLKKKNHNGSEKDSLVQLGERACRRSIAIYENWLDNYQDSTLKDIKNSISKEFLAGLPVEDQADNYLENRAREYQQARLEVPRRLSVAYTNLGVVHRFHGDYKTAAKLYRQALDLWDQNLSAENNMNHLMGLPLKKKNFIQKMFPQDRLK